MKLASICPYACPLRSQNILIGSFSGIQYRDFLLHLGPVAVLGLLLDWLVLWRLYFRARVHDVRTEIAPEPLNVVHAALVKAGVVAVLVLVGFLSGFPPPLVAAVGAAIMLITRTVDPHRRFYHSDRGAVEPGEQRARSDVAEVAGHSIFEPAHGMVDTCHGKHACRKPDDHGFCRQYHRGGASP